MCGICGGEVHVNGDGDLLCMGSCGSVLTREEIDADEPSHPQVEEWDSEWEEYQDFYEG